jgi:putative transposon-encoded protein
MKQSFFKSWMFELVIVLVVAIGLISYIHFNKKENIQTTQPFAYVQLGDHPWLVHVQKSLEPVANQIINNEVLKVNPASVDIPKFYIKKRNIITLLYSYSYSDDLHETVIKNVQQSLQAVKTPVSKVYFSSHLDWFGRNQSELVVKIDDPKHSLSKIREHILKGLQESKIQSSDATLYDVLCIQDANKFDFTPHESIGRIDVKKIEQLSNHQTVEKIKHKISNALHEIITSMKESNEIVPSQIEIYGNNFKTIAAITIS